MRISDWSSDVCSSDLRDYFLHAGKQRELVLAQQNIIRLHWKMEGGELELHCHLAMSLSYNCFSKQNLDRKSVVMGMSVSVRVDLGGSRIIKKQNIDLHQHIYKIHKYAFTKKQN